MRGQVAGVRVAVADLGPRRLDFAVGIPTPTYFSLAYSEVSCTQVRLNLWLSNPPREDGRFKSGANPPDLRTLADVEVCGTK